jgi:adenylate cyclase
MRLLGMGPSPLNRRLCRSCIRSIHKRPGGSEVEVSLLFADVRGSTTLAERMAPGEFSGLMARFYGTAGRVVDKWDGLIDKFVGDEVVALFVPGFAGPDHAARAVGAARELVTEAAGRGHEPTVPIGAAVHTGMAFVGTVGQGDVTDFTALGDAVNIAARLVSEAGPGELLMSAAASTAAQIETTGLERRPLKLRGRDQTVDVWVTPIATRAT